MIAGIKLVYAISNCPTISDEDKIKALDDIIDMVKTDYIDHVICETDESTKEVWPLRKIKSDNTAGGILTGLFAWDKSKLGGYFWNKIHYALYATNS
jgi:hypothetical protein